MSKLTPAKIKAITKPGRYGDGDGLHLYVRQGRRGLVMGWVLRKMFEGKRRDITLGKFPAMSLERARAAAAAEHARVSDAVAAGETPYADHDTSNAAPTFADVLAEVIARKEARGDWKPGSTSSLAWHSHLQNHALPRIGHLPVTKVGRSEVLAVLTPIWDKRPAAARSVKQKIKAVLDFAAEKGYVPEGQNPAAHRFRNVLGTEYDRTHYRSVDYAETPAIFAGVERSAAGLPVRLALQFLILTATRGVEVREATWREIDPADATWTIPAERLKGGKRNGDHIVPLSTEAMAVLGRMRETSAGNMDPDGLVFSGGEGRVIGKNTMGHTLRRLGVPADPHGFRASFRAWAEENTSAPWAVMEQALHHKVRDPNRGAYRQKVQLLEKRRALMQEWSDFLSDGEAATEAA